MYYRPDVILADGLLKIIKIKEVVPFFSIIANFYISSCHHFIKSSFSSYLKKILQISAAHSRLILVPLISGMTGVNRPDI
jgi:hypothetical protein